MDYYTLIRNWFNWAFENPSKITPAHGILYIFCIEHCNRLGWKQEFGLPTTMAKDAIGIRSYNTYINTLNDLIEWGFIILIEKSTNQYSSNIIALSKFDKALDKALDKAMIKHYIKQRESTIQSNSSIDIQDTSIQDTSIQVKKKKFQAPDILEVEKYFLENGYTQEAGKKAFNYYDVANWHDVNGKQILNWKQKMHSVWFKTENLIIQPAAKMRF